MKFTVSNQTDIKCEGCGAFTRVVPAKVYNTDDLHCLCEVDALAGEGSDVAAGADLQDSKELESSNEDDTQLDADDAQDGTDDSGRDLPYFHEYTKAQLKEILEEQGVEYKVKAGRKELYAQVEELFYKVEM